MNVTKKIKMDLAHKENIQCIDVVQGDAYTRKIEFSLFENGQKWMIPDLVSVAISYRGGSGSGIYDKLPDETPAFEISENIVTITIVPQAISASGNTNVSVLFSDENGKQLSTFSVVLNSVQNPATGAGEPKDYYNIREWVGAGPLWVNVTKNDNGQYVSDKTISQIQVANKGGRSVYCILKIDENDNMQLPMTNVESNAFVFSALINGEEWSVNFDAHEITVSCAPVVIVLSQSRNLSENATASTSETGMVNASSGWFGRVKAGETYTFSADFHKPVDAGSKNIGVRVYSAKSGGTNLQEKTLSYSSVPVGSTKRLSGTFTATGDGYVSLNGSFGTLDDVFKSFEIATNIQLEAGEVATEYIPYGVKEVLNAERVLNTEKKVAELEETVSEIDKRTEPYVISESRNLSEQATASTTATGMLNTSCGWFGHVKAGQVYTFSADFHKPADAGSKNIGVRVYDKETGKNNIQETVVAYSSVPVGGTKRLSGTFTAIGDGYVSMNGNFRIDNAPIEGFSSYEIATNIQLEEGEVATEYKPYGEKITVDGEFVADLAQRMEDVEEAVTEGVKVGAYASHVKSVAHQGASGFGYPQNTVENIIACAKHGWKLAEFDVIWTSDNVPVISHDDARTIYGSAETITISTSTYEDVAAARLFEDASMKISTFYEAIDACKLYGLTAVIEIKGSLTSARLDDLVAYLKRRNMLRKCAWISFNLDPLVQVRNRDPKADVLLCLSQAKDTTWVDGESRLSTLLEGEGETVLNYSRNALSGVEDLETYLNGMREYGFLIGAWTIDTAEVVQQYAPYLDYITSNVYKVEDVLA